MKPIIFLDIDDVIATDTTLSGIVVAEALQEDWETIDKSFWRKVFLDEAIENLLALDKSILAQYVISSSWANYLTRNQIEYVFGCAGIGNIAYKLHRNWRTPKAKSVGRLTEIHAWISKYSFERRPILIIDDDDSGWNLIGSDFDKCGQLVICKRGAGFTKNKLNESLILLEKQIRPVIPKNDEAK